jgi:membrane protease subunit (stomatin/prohibitin family)
MGLYDFITKQFIDVIHWTEEEEDILAYRYPMEDMEIQTGAQLTVRESQMAALVNQGRMADVFDAGLYTLTTRTLPLLTDLMNWDKLFNNPFKSDVYFFSTRQKTGQRWGTATPITIRDKEFGAVQVRGYGIYSYHLTDPRIFQTKISGTRDIYTVSDLETQLRNTIVGRISDTFAESGIAFLDMAANQAVLAQRVAANVRPAFTEVGLTLDTFVIESLSLPEDLQQALNTRVGMNMIGDLGRFTQYQAAHSMSIAAANEGNGAAGAGIGMGAGIAMANVMNSAMSNATASKAASSESSTEASSGGVAVAADPALKFCVDCGKQIQRTAKFCAECGHQQ